MSARFGVARQVCAYVDYPLSCVGRSGNQQAQCLSLVSQSQVVGAGLVFVRSQPVAHSPPHSNRRAAIFRDRWAWQKHTYLRYSSPHAGAPRQVQSSINHKMRWLVSFTVAFVWSVVVQAKSFTGNRLLVVLEEQAEREKYSVFLEDLTCKLWISSIVSGDVVVSSICARCDAKTRHWQSSEAIQLATWPCAADDAQSNPLIVSQC